VGEELHRVLGLRPCLAVPALFERAVVSMEAEVGGAVALLILKHLTGLAPMYTEVFTVDLAENALLIGHAGMHDAPNLVERPEEITIEPDGEYVESEPDSAWMRFRAKGGPVTLLSVFQDVERFKLVIARGIAVGGPPRLLGSPHAYVQLSTPLPEFFERAIRSGMTQHWALVHADVTAELVALADLLHLDKILL
jgi:L-arabinose isomerase